MAFIDYRLVQELNAQTLRGNTTYILVKLAPGVDEGAVADEIRRRLPFNDVHTQKEWAALSRRYWVANTGLGFNLFITVFLGCLVGVVVVAQTLYTSTMEHLKEFGTVKAIGGTNGDIYSILIRQAVVAALIGYVLGAVPALLMRPGVARSGLKLILEPQFLAVVLVGTIVLCVAASLLSFSKVAHIDPDLVFRS
jgi:putative ABC transport system permease protein